MTRLLFATTNEGKLAELKALIGGDVEVLSLRDFQDVPTSGESGDTFEANAEEKALFYAQATKVPALADDSGLCVDALNGAPGVHSARYAEGSDLDRMQKLLRELEGITNRAASFRCALTLALPSGKTVTEVGECQGTIADAPRGMHGFGYDPVFELASGKTMAELNKMQKSAISHRGDAFRKMRRHLEALAVGALR